MVVHIYITVSEDSVRYYFRIRIGSVSLGNIIEIHCTYDPKTKSGSGFNERKPNGTIHYVEATTALKARFNLFEPLIMDEKVSTQNFKERLKFAWQNRKTILNEVDSPKIRFSKIFDTSATIWHSYHNTFAVSMMI